MKNHSCAKKHFERSADIFTQSMGEDHLDPQKAITAPQKLNLLTKVINGSLAIKL